MELKVFRDTLTTMGSLWETKAELPIETELLIPDYLPQVFKIVGALLSRHPAKAGDARPPHGGEGYLRCVVYYQAEDDQSLCQSSRKFPSPVPWTCRRASTRAIPSR